MARGRPKKARWRRPWGSIIERLNNNHFYAGSFWGEDIANAAFVHYPNERWFKPGQKDALPKEILDDVLPGKFTTPMVSCVART